MNMSSDVWCKETLNVWIIDAFVRNMMETDAPSALQMKEIPMSGTMGLAKRTFHEVSASAPGDMSKT
jgi:hypothetical protein